ncbi:hypothetical protein [Haloquadratum walsbyi]|nr:hypothetical protein [Haloquadratum walsbyi]
MMQGQSGVIRQKSIVAAGVMFCSGRVSDLQELLNSSFTTLNSRDSVVEGSLQAKIKNGSTVDQ